jgi:hypothetical protein
MQLSQAASAPVHAAAGLMSPQPSCGSGSSSNWGIPMHKVRAVVAVGGTFRPVAGTGAWEYVGDVTYKVVGIPRAATYAELQALLVSRAELDPSLSSCSIKVSLACRVLQSCLAGHSISAAVSLATQPALPNSCSFCHSKYIGSRCHCK